MPVDFITMLVVIIFIAGKRKVKSSKKDYIPI